MSCCLLLLLSLVTLKLFLSVMPVTHVLTVSDTRVCHIRFHVVTSLDDDCYVALCTNCH